MVGYNWTWKDATPRERGIWVRQSLRDCLSNRDKLRELFNLTEDGVDKILNGSDWYPEFEMKD